MEYERGVAFNDQVAIYLPDCSNYSCLSLHEMPLGKSECIHSSDHDGGSGGGITARRSVVAQSMWYIFQSCYFGWVLLSFPFLLFPHPIEMQKAATVLYSPKHAHCPLLCKRHKRKKTKPTCIKQLRIHILAV